VHDRTVQRADRAKIIVSHDPSYIRQHCDNAAVLMEASSAISRNWTRHSEYYTQGTAAHPGQ
jgi:capsular polysaccharide transport system ATP-binding protein